VKNIAKSVFVSSYLMFCAFLASYAAYRLAQGDRAMLAWIGVLLTTVPLLLLIGRATLLQDVARTSDRLPVINALGVGGILMAGWTAYSGVIEWRALVGAVLMWVGFLVYAYWYSSFDRTPSGELRVGQRLPAFVVHDIQGRTVSSTELSQQAAILIFFRGNWCPLCMAQIKEIAAQYQKLLALQVRVALISPQPQHKTATLASRFNVNFDFLVDADNRAARALGIDLPFGLPLGMQMLGYENDTVMPTVVITDREGRVIWTHQTDNYRVRPDPETYINVLQSHRVIG
jgi:peroxiredoxin